VASREKLLPVNLILLLYGLWLLGKYNKAQLQKWVFFFALTVVFLSSLGLSGNLTSLPMALLLLWPISVAILSIIRERKILFYIYFIVALYETVFWFYNYV